MINTNYLNPKNIKIDKKKSCNNIFIYYVRCETSDRVTPLHIIFNKIKWYIESKNESKYLTLIRIDENQGAIKKYKDIWNKSKYLIKPTFQTIIMTSA